jgi:hypothetical protein
MQHKAIYIPLRMSEAEALCRLAREQDRRPRDQAARLLREALREHGVLEDINHEAARPEPALAK